MLVVVWWLVTLFYETSVIVLNRRTEVIMSNNIQLENDCMGLIEIVFGDEFEIMQECLN